MFLVTSCVDNFIKINDQNLFLKNQKSVNQGIRFIHILLLGAFFVLFNEVKI